MSPDALRQAVEHAGIAAAGIGFLAGLTFSFNPVAMASIPVSLAYVTKARERKQAILFGSIFVLGMILVQTVLGFVAGFGGGWAASLVGLEHVPPRLNRRIPLGPGMSDSIGIDSLLGAG